MCAANKKTAAALKSAPLDLLHEDSGNAVLSVRNAKVSARAATIDKTALLSVGQVAELLSVTSRSVNRQCAAGKFPHIVRERCPGGIKYLIPLSDLPSECQSRYWGAGRQQEIIPDADASPAERMHSSQQFAEAPEYNRQLAEKWTVIFEATKGLKGKALAAFIAKWNAANPSLKVTERSVRRKRAEFEKHGAVALLGKYGATARMTHAFSSSRVDEELKAQQDKILEGCFDVFKRTYLTEGGPSIHECWRVAFGYWMRQGGGGPELFDGRRFPGEATFVRRLRNEASEGAIYHAREGYEKWNRKYGRFVDRTYDDIAPGEVLVLDHAQLDVAVLEPAIFILAGFDEASIRRALDSKKPCFPWISAASDLRTGKMTGWCLHTEAPNSDHVGLSLKHSISRHGVPRLIYIDNGKDYQSMDISGGSPRKARFQLDEAKTRSLVGSLGIEVKFALPFNPQAKSIERNFLRIKNSFSRFCIGYRGGNVVERPEKLQGEIDRLQIMRWPEFVEVFEKFLVDVLDNQPVAGKHLHGRSPSQAWAEFSKDARYIPAMIPNESALALYTMRVSRSKRIARNGFYDPQLEMHYWCEEMAAHKGRKVFLRRDPRKWQTAFVFDDATGGFLWTAELVNPVPAIAETDLDRERVRDAIRAKNADAKRARKAGYGGARMSTSEIIELQAAANAALAPMPDQTEPVRMIRAAGMGEDVLSAVADARREGKCDLGLIAPDVPAPKKKYVLFESDMDEDLRGPDA